MSHARRLYVLLVDDDRDFLRLMARMLERHGHVASTAATAVGLVERVTAGVRPDVIVLDRGLPGVTGHDALRALAKDDDTRDIPVLFTSASPVGLDLDMRSLHPCCRTFLKNGHGKEIVAAVEAVAAPAGGAVVNAGVNFGSSAGGAATTPRLLLAEDDIDVREQAADWLEEAGFHIDTANDGAEAIAALSSGPRPDAIVLDLMMPTVSGWAVYEWLRSSPCADVPVIIWTAAGAAASSLRHARIVEKGKDPQILLDTIRASTVWARGSRAAVAG